MEIALGYHRGLHLKNIVENISLSQTPLFGMHFYTKLSFRTPSLIFILLAILMVANSCGKEYSFEAGEKIPGSNNPTNTLKDSVYIDHIVTTRLKNGTYDTTLKTQFTYDDQNRMKGWYDHPIIAEGNIETMEFSYMANDTLPYYAYSTRKDAGSVDSTILQYYFFYDELGRKTVDSVLTKQTNGPENAGYVDRFYYAPGIVVKVGQYREPGTIYDYRDTGVVNNEGDFTEHRFYDYGPDKKLRLTMHNRFSYDNKNHIYSHINIRNTIPMNEGGGDFYKYAARHNIVQQDLDFPVAQWSQNTDNEFTYNKFDLPLIAHKRNNSSDLKCYFYYRALN